MPSAPAAAFETFEFVRGERIASLRVEAQEFRHRGTGAPHFHLAADHRENVFLVALRTVPGDSTGVAHILEHTVLCGSEKYPVRDPFFLMLRRSLNTFMNAFTSSDWTAYPFASQNRKDFGNLLEVYLDAVFFSRLDPLDFAQEGHRLEFADPEAADSPLAFKGVVFNEMKGAMSAPVTTLWQTLCSHLFPSNTYHYNSGGDPACIPDLSYAQLKAFYETHYHPANAIFMTFGDIPAREHQSVFEAKALSRFGADGKRAAVPETQSSKANAGKAKRSKTKSGGEKPGGAAPNPHRIAVPLEQRFTEPKRAQEPYAFDESGSLKQRTHIVIGWLLGESTELEKMLEAQLLTSVLLDHSASPLRKALETTALGRAPSPLCGLDEDMREMVFVCGLEGGEAEDAAAVEALVLGVLRDVAENGVPQSELESVLHQLELHQREISGGSYPYGLQLILSALNYAAHYADPAAALNLDPAIETLRARIMDPDYIRRLARELLLDNPHRVTLTMPPDRELSARREQAEAARLADIRRELDDAGSAAIREKAAQLAARQAAKDDASILPKVGLADVPPDIPRLHPRRGEGAGYPYPCALYAQGTNGLCYQQVVMPLPRMSAAELGALPYYAYALTEVGLDGQDYLAAQARQAAAVGSLRFSTSMRSLPGDVRDARAFAVLSAKALARNHRAQAELLRDTLESARFDERGRIRELIAQLRARRAQSVTRNGHGLAMGAACAGMNPLARLRHHLSGLEGIRACKALDDALGDDAALDAFCAELAELHQRIAKQPRQLLLIGEEDCLDDMVAANRLIWPASGHAGADAPGFPEPMEAAVRELWITDTQVNFCARAWPTVPAGHEDAPALTVLGGFLRNGYLHTAIREKGGAYGGGAGQDSTIGAFRFFSYRDPRLLDTLDDFDQSLHWLLNHRHEDDAIEQAVLGVISGIDKPSSPAGEARRHFHNELFGRSHEQREEFRRRVLELSLDDLRRAAETWLRPGAASTAILTSQATYDRLDGRLEDVSVQAL